MNLGNAPSGQRCALPIPAGMSPGDLAQPPESGEQYMLRVRLEAASIPDVVVAPRRAELLRQIDSRAGLPAGGAERESGPGASPPLPAILRPSEEWLSGVARHLTRERARLMAAIDGLDVPADFAIPGCGQQREWKAFCYGAVGAGPSPDRVILYALASMDQAMAVWLIKRMTSWMSVDGLRRAEGVWAWYLVLKLDSLLDHDDMHALRELCRKLVAILANVGHSIGQDAQATLNIRGDEIAAINILIASTTRGYRQRDLEPWA
ncbi:gem (nuclear organelle) associated protein 2 [Coemansia biformis]|uniref:Gem (Nuclear organelle) associated protein 2 n=1 Tax=Coemansia biformis TaxID=1286918 RepID=A0A9W8CXU6_9FUNG|nr:gem (nuclear organelle) associated protein 2 [Coemansia biformis]